MDVPNVEKAEKVEAAELKTKDVNEEEKKNEDDQIKEKEALVQKMNAVQKTEERKQNKNKNVLVIKNSWKNLPDQVYIYRRSSEPVH